MLRNQYQERDATYAPPVHGVNLRTNLLDLGPGESPLMQNCFFDGSLRIRRGNQRLTPTSLGAFTGRGGHKYYFGGPNPQSRRLVAYGTTIASVSGSGIATTLTTGMTNGQHTYFTTWPITDKVYISSGTDTLRAYDGTTLSVLSGTNIPVPRTAVVPVLDRLLCITDQGIERTDARSDTVWSFNSSWATLRPKLPGLFTALVPFSLKGSDTIADGALAFQERAFYHITGADFGTSVIAASPPVGEDASITLLDSTVGTASPDSVCTVPGLGVFWFTTDLNVFWLPEGSFSGRYIGDKIQSTGATPGIEATNSAALRSVWMTYFDQMVVLSIPTGANPYASTQWWLDTRRLRLDPNDIVWYGPMTGQTIAKAWVENQQGDNAMYGIEGDSTAGCFVYQLRVPGRYTDSIGLVDTPVSVQYQTSFKDFGAGSREKYVQAIHFDMNSFAGTATADIVDLNSTIASNLPITVV